MGVGSGFTAVEYCDAGVETMRGHTLGRVIYSGSALPNTNIPGLIGGFAGERVLRAPCDGIFTALHRIGDTVEEGETIGFVEGQPMKCTISGVLRGVHFQKEPTQGKLVRVTKGEVYDVAVDCRPHSATFGKWVGVTLSEEHKKMFYIPEGFAHGFLGLSDVAEFCYKCTDVYDPTSEGGIPYDDPTVNVQWPDCGCEHKTSAKDKLHEPFAAQKFEFFEKW